jgi:hypothetical protein
MRKVFTSLIFGSLLVVASATPVLAADIPTQTRAALQVNPAIVEQLVEPGKTERMSIVVTNQSSTPLPITTAIRRLEVLEGDQVQNNDIFDASAWFKIVDGEFILQAGESHKVFFDITPPPKAEPGGHYATVYFEPLVPAEELAPNTAHLTAQVGSLIFLTVKGDAVTQLGLGEPLTTVRWRQFGPVPFQFQFKNTGSTHVLPGGSVKLYDWRGNQVDEITWPPGVVLPKTSRTIKLEWSRRALFGRYTAKLEAVYGANHPPVTSTVTFWVVPALAMALIIIFVIGFSYIMFRTRGRWGRVWAVLRSNNSD